MATRNVRNTAYYESVYADYNECVLTVNEIAKKYNISIRTIYNIKAVMDEKVKNGEIELKKKNKKIIVTETPRKTKREYDCTSEEIAENHKYKKKEPRKPNNFNINIDLDQVNRDFALGYLRPEKTTKASKNYSMFVDMEIPCYDPLSKQNREMTAICKESWDVYNNKYKDIDEKPKLTKAMVIPSSSKQYTNNLLCKNKQFSDLCSKKPEKDLKSTQSVKSIKIDTSSIYENKNTKVVAKVNKEKPKLTDKQKEKIQKRNKIAEDALAFLENHRKTRVQ